MKVALNVDGSRVRRWHIDLQRRLSDPYREVWLEPGLQPAACRALWISCSPWSGSRSACPGDGPREPVRVPGALRPEGAARDLTIVLDGADLPQPGYSLLFDGEPGEAALFAALLAGRSPTIELVGCEGVAARGVASLEAAQGLTGAYAAVVAPGDQPRGTDTLHARPAPSRGCRLVLAPPPRRPAMPRKPWATPSPDASTTSAATRLTGGWAGASSTGTTSGPRAVSAGAHGESWRIPVSGFTPIRSHSRMRAAATSSSRTTITEPAKG
jgi:hypothetical protein